MATDNLGAYLETNNFFLCDVKPRRGEAGGRRIGARKAEALDIHTVVDAWGLAVPMH